MIDFIEKNRDKIGQQEPAAAKEEEPAKDELWEKHLLFSYVSILGTVSPQESPPVLWAFVVREKERS